MVPLPRAVFDDLLDHSITLPASITYRRETRPSTGEQAAPAGAVQASVADSAADPWAGLLDSGLKLMETFAAAQSGNGRELRSQIKAGADALKRGDFIEVDEIDVDRYLEGLTTKTG
ncbi:MAG: hypothetical protein ACREQZ_15085 [Woeseiaceae bacterium]